MPRQTAWPALPLETWRDTCDRLHMFTQIVGKIKLALAPEEPQWAHVALYVTSRGLTTGPMPGNGKTFAAAPRTMPLDFDFIAHQLGIATSDGQTARVACATRALRSSTRQS